MMSSYLSVSSNLKNRNGRIFARVPMGLKEKLIESSRKSGRNLTSELIIRIAHSLDEHDFIECIPEWLVY